MLEIIGRLVPKRLMGIEGFDQEFIGNLQPMLVVADAWLDDRPTMRSIYQVGSDLNVLKHHFLKTYRRHIIGAEEEAVELCRARSRERQIEELGDVAFYLLHFFRAAGLDIDQFGDFLNGHESLSNQRIIKLSSPLQKVAGRGLVLRAVREVKKALEASHHLLFGGPMSFGDAKTDGPWLNDRDSQQWLDFKEEIGCRWMAAFGSVMSLARQMDLKMLPVIEQTSLKASWNFPKMFFNPDFSWFSLDPNGDRHDVACCRLFREVNRAGDEISYLDLFHIGNDEEGFTPERFRSFVKKSLEEIAQSRDGRARFLLGEIEHIERKMPALSLSGGLP